MLEEPLAVPPAELVVVLAELPREEAAEAAQRAAGDGIGPELPILETPARHDQESAVDVRVVGQDQLAGPEPGLGDEPLERREEDRQDRLVGVVRGVEGFGVGEWHDHDHGPDGLVAFARALTGGPRQYPAGEVERLVVHHAAVDAEEIVSRMFGSFPNSSDQDGWTLSNHSQ